MKLITIYHLKRVFALALLTVAVAACKKGDNPNNLPDVNAKDYEGTVDGYKSSDEVASKNLVAYWSFDGDLNEKISGTAPTTVAGNTFVDAGLKGKALSLNSGFLYFAKQFDAFKTANFKSFTISTWVQILNNGSKRTMVFQLARPGVFNGNINFILNTNSFPATNTNELKINPTFTGVNGGMQDNINTLRDSPGMPNYVPYLTPQIGATKWTHLLLTYETTTGFFNIWADGVKVGAFSSRGVGNSTFNSFEPSEVIFGGNYNIVPGKAVNADANFAAMTGRIDEFKIWNIALTDAHIKAIFNLGKAGK
ncbi:MAG: LamG-like jellyroll fold domain-containing protein [Pedobacter sp.]|uniref:LamG-like jellyroll fold domain-containing protein n=1 Tax=Pedobacter sp. TaxID=1411316 RepID=UPI0028095762|nr:LamG-like jellyroll fold domain-containing protein [Pedobacter sp.]MDQ8005198.1 LamG-like jellyroll fold domain-containing protein [Pedobacter sp.]